MSALFNAGFVVRVPSWHRLENTIFDEYPGRDEAYVAAGHDFDVREAFVGDEGGIIDDPSTFNGPMLRVRNDDTGMWEWRSYARSMKEKGLRIFQMRDGVPGPLHGKTIKHVLRTYEPIQNSVPWDLLDAILSDGSANGVSINYETGGVLEDGASCFITAYLDKPFQVDGDDSPVYPYLFANWRHDGGGALVFGETDVRIVCANTRGMAEAQAASRNRLYTFKHTKNVLDRVNDVKMMLKGVMVEHNAFETLANELASIEVTEKQRSEFVARFVPYPASALAEDLQVTDRVARNIEEARAAVRSCFNSRSIPEAHRLTGWGLYNAATEYLDHLRPGRGGSPVGSNPTSYVKRQLLTRNTAKDVIVPLIKEVAGVAA